MWFNIDKLCPFITLETKNVDAVKKLQLFYSLQFCLE